MQETGVADAHEAIPDHEDAHVLLAEELVEEFAESRAHFLFEVFQKNFLNFLRTFFEKWEKKEKKCLRAGSVAMPHDGGVRCCK